MPVLGRGRRRHRARPAADVMVRRTLIVELPEAPGSDLRPAPLVLPAGRGGAAFRLPTQGHAVRELAAFLAAVDVAPLGAVLDVAAGSAEHALLAAVYSTRLVRALEADPDRAHAARQTAATNALPVVVEERRLATSRNDATESLDAYVRRTALEPALIRLGPAAEVEGLLAGASDLLHRGRPWLVLESDHTAGALLGQVSDLVALGYRVITETDINRDGSGYVLAPEGAETAFARRFEAWSAALLPAGPATGLDDMPGAPAVIDVSTHETARTTT
jgi:hypothetical protein